MVNKNQLEVLYTLGAGHCGSTLLNLALDRHSQIVGVSEIINLNQFRSGQAGGIDLCDEPFWLSVAQAYNASNPNVFWDISFDARVIGKSISAEVWRKKNLYALQSVAYVTGKPIIADSSKDPRRLAALLRIPGISIKVIYLVRDARALVHSYDRKYKSWRHGARKLARHDRLAMRIKKKMPAEDWLTLRYEDLATHFEQSLREVCTFAGVSFDTAMLKPDTANYKGIGGNRIRNSPVRSIKRDDAWLQEMAGWKQALTGLVFFRYNLRNGYIYR